MILTKVFSTKYHLYSISFLYNGHEVRDVVEAKT